MKVTNARQKRARGGRGFRAPFLEWNGRDRSLPGDALARWTPEASRLPAPAASSPPALRRSDLTFPLSLTSLSPVRAHGASPSRRRARVSARLRNDPQTAPRPRTLAPPAAARVEAVEAYAAAAPIATHAPGRDVRGRSARAIVLAGAWFLAALLAVSSAAWSAGARPPAEAAPEAPAAP